MAFFLAGQFEARAPAYLSDPRLPRWGIAGGAVVVVLLCVFAVRSFRRAVRQWANEEPRR
jgi:hypothetical protein